MSYYNTTNLSGQALRERQLTARTSTWWCLKVMKEYKSASPWQVYGILWMWNDKQEKYPITSVRRAMNTLEKMGLIRKMNYKRVAKKTGALEHIYHII